jgi:hypothetical protein
MATVTVYGGTDYDLSSGTITNPYYSTHKAPQGFPLSPTKWSIIESEADGRQQNPTEDVWYNIGGSMSIPIGEWNVDYHMSLQIDRGTAGQLYLKSTFSTGNNTETNTASTFTGQVPSQTSIRFTPFVQFFVAATSKTTYYLNVATPTSSITNLRCQTNQAPTIIRATCAYL